MDTNIIAAIIGAVATLLAVAVPLLRDWRIRNDIRYKLTYVKVIHLTRRAQGRPPVYQTEVSRLRARVDVYDELQYFRLNIYHGDQKDFLTTGRTSGVIDLQVLYPWQDRLHFTDAGAETIAQFVTQAVPVRSNVFLTRTVHYNGFQPGSEDIGLKLENDADEARLIVDFSSVPNVETLFTRLPSGSIRSHAAERSIGVVQVAPGVFSLEGYKLRKDDVIRMNFEVNWSVVDATPAVRGGV